MSSHPYRFKNKISYERYLNSATITNLKALCKEANLLQEPQTDRMGYPLIGFLHRSKLEPDPYVVVASISYKPGKREESLDSWSPIVSSIERDAKEVYTYLLLADSQDENLLWSIERFQNQDYQRQVHVKRKDVLQNMVLQKDIREPGGLHHWHWTQIGEVHENIEDGPAYS